MRKNVKERKRRYNVNHNYFKKWSSNMSYIYGLWASDGYISTGKRKRKTFGITLNIIDDYLLKKILKEMSCDKKLYINKNTSNIIIYSSQIYDDIVGIGGMERKSLYLDMPSIPDEYIKDFIRGYFDGDGSIYKLKYRNGYGANIASASKKFIYSLKDILKEKISGIKLNIYSKNKKRKNPIYIMEMSTNNTKLFCSYIYSGNAELYLKRKFNIWNDKCDKEIIPATKDVIFYDYLKSKEYVKYIIAKNKIQTKRQWHNFFEDNNGIMKGIPSHPEIIYKDKGWTNWYDWLGKKKGEK